MYYKYPRKGDMKKKIMIIALLLLTVSGAVLAKITYPIVDTNQTKAFDNQNEIPLPKPGEPFYGQDANYAGNTPRYKNNGNGTVSDRVTGLMWTANPGEKIIFAKAVKGAKACRAGGYDDWRLPSIKELYSLILFSGFDPDPRSEGTKSLVPYINNTLFDFSYGNVEQGERIIDSQYATSTKYVSTTMRNNETLFGVNFADGRIKGYPIVSPRGEKKYFVHYVRGNPAYGKNRFRDNADGTVTDEATGLTWTKSDSGKGMDWRSALKYAEDLELAGYTDWRLPNAKELHSIVDYSRSPDTADSAAIDPIFDATEIKNEDEKKDFGWYWTGTTHQQVRRARAAVYIAFGRAGGFMRSRRTGKYQLLDVHGAGAQRSDPKTGDASHFPHGRGPQGDVIRIENFVRCVRDSNKAATSKPDTKEPVNVKTQKPNFVFILADDMGWTGTSVQIDDRIAESKSDYYQTPNLEKLAQQGLRFTQAYAPGSLCTPTRAAILTGITPAELHVTTPGGGRAQESRKLLTPRVPLTKIKDDEITIAEALKEAGYATAHLGKWHLGQNSHPGEHGFDVHDGNTGNNDGAFEDPNPKDIFGITERAVAFMKEQTLKKKPFYLHLSHYAVHSPTMARKSTVKTFEKLPKGKRHQDASYAAMTFDLDASIGTVLAEIKKLGIAENTFVIFMSDNGAPGGPRRRAENQPLAGGKSQLNEGGIRVPFIARGPGIPNGAICREAITGCDLLPTFCELAGILWPAKIEGASLVPLLTGKAESFQRKEESLLFHYPHYGKGPDVPQSALVVGKYKIIRNYESGSVKLFDLVKDISETNDLAGAMPEKTRELEKLLDNRLKRANAQMPSVNPNYDPDMSVTRGQRKGPGRNREATRPRRRQSE